MAVKNYIVILLLLAAVLQNAQAQSRRADRPQVLRQAQTAAKDTASLMQYIVDENGVKRQRWETFASQAEAKKRKAQIEYQQSTGTFIAPTAKTIRELLEEYINIYGINTWALSTYESRRALIDNYINPIIGDMPLEQATPRVMDKVKEVHKILRNAFNQAVKWEMISRNPVLNATLPKCETKPREIWTADTLFHALELCDDDNLALALNLAFSCSLRMGEMLALTWDCIDISAESISHDCASIFVNKELQRVQKQSLEMLDGKGVIKVFPSILVSKHTALVLKEPKTKTSIRKVFLPKTVAEMLLKRQAEQNELKELFEDEYTDYGLVFCSPMGTPIEGQVINRALNKLIEDNGLPKVVFHSLRHSSITYKLKLNGGDMKSVQGDSGHAQLKMVADVYSHIIDEDRRLNAKRFEDAFYSGHKTEDELDGLHARSIEQAAAPQPAEPETDQQLLLKLLNNPEMAALLKTLAKSL